MDVIEAIHTRRSVRSYEDRPVPMDVVRELLAAAMSAPSAGNAQPWQFVLIDDRAVLEQVKTINPYGAMAARAALGILVCGDITLEKFAGYWVQDCSAATQNLLLAAHAKGLGAVWTGIHPMPERIAGFRALVGLPEHVAPLALVVLGYPAQQTTAQDRFRGDRVHHNTWGNRLRFGV